MENSPINIVFYGNKSKKEFKDYELCSPEHFCLIKKSEEILLFRHLIVTLSYARYRLRFRNNVEKERRMRLNN